MAERRRAADDAQRGRALTNGSQRLARLLLELTGLARDGDGRAASAPPLSQEELASLIGSSRATVTRALSQWRARGIIRTRQRQIVVLDRAALQRLGGPG
jgi:CRP-like cAMP-binding protein